jgi:hypothetical protein
MTVDMIPENPTYELTIAGLNQEKCLSVGASTLYEYLATLGRDAVTVMIADNGSIDATDPIAQKLVEQYPRTRDFESPPARCTACT